MNDGRKEADVKGITPFLWFDDQAEEAAKHYVSIFSSVGRGQTRITDVTPMVLPPPRPPEGLLGPS